MTVEFHVNPSHFHSSSVRRRLRSVRDFRPVVQGLESRELMTVWYVATTGANGNPGSLALPFGTIQRAADLAQPGDTVMVRGGTYRESVVLPRSGSPGNPIVFQPYNNEHVIISGADIVNGPFDPVAGQSYYAATNVTGFTSSLNQAEQVFVNGQMIEWARSPNGGADVSAPATAIIPAGGVTAPSLVSGTNYQVTITDPSRWTAPAGTLTGSMISVVMNGGSAVTGQVVADGAGSITFQYNANGAPGAYTTPVAGDRYQLFGTLPQLDAPGEWFRNSATNTLYMRTLTDVDPDTVTVEVKRRDYAFLINLQSDITIRGFEIFAATVSTEDADGDLRQFQINPSSRVTIEGIDAEYVTHFTDKSEFIYSQWSTTSGIILSGSDQILRDSVIGFSAGNGVSVFGARNKVLNNIIHDTNYMKNEGGAICTGFQNTTSVDLEIGNNTIYKSGHAGILMRNLTSTSATTPARIHNNDISQVMLQGHDMGAIYAWGTNGNGTRIDHNRIHDVSTQGYGYGAPSIYLDDGSQNYVIDHNVVWNADRPQLNSNTSGFKIYHNTIATATGGLGFGANATGHDIRNNIVPGGIAGAPGGTIANNLANGENPAYVDAAAYNFALTAGSPAVNAGAVIPPYSDGASGAPDLGAYELGVAPWTAGSTLVTGPTADAPLAPSNLTAALAAPSVNGPTVQLLWTDNSSNEKEFIIERALRSGGTSTFAAIARVAPNTTSYLDASLMGGTYDYRIRADDSAYSNIATVVTPRIAQTVFPAATYDAQSGSLNVFGPNVGNSSPGAWVRFDNVDFGALNSVTGFFATYATSSSGNQITARLDNPTTGLVIATLNTVSSGGFGTYHTTSTTASGASGVRSVYVIFSNWGTANLASIGFSGGVSVTPPAAPTNLAGTAVAGPQNNLTWTDNATGESEYRVERSFDNAHFTELASLPAQTVSYADSTGLAANTAVFYRIRAVNPGGFSEYSNTVRLVTTSASAPITTTTGLSALPGTVALGQNVVLTATITPASGTPPTGGVVDFRADGALLSSVPVVNGSAVLTVSTLGVGTHGVTATFQPGAGFVTSVSSPVTVNVVNVVAPTVESIVINQGAVQRSRVTRIDVTFSTLVNLGPNALSLTRTSATGGGTVGLNAALTAVGGKTVAALTFNGPLTEFTSLADGAYQLAVNPLQVQETGSSLNVPMAAAVNQTFHRLFGDADGDADVDAIDILRFRQALAGAYVAYLDYDGNGVINTVDSNRLRSNMFRRLTY